MSEALPTGGHLSRNLVFFARALRAAGLKVGPDRVARAVEAVALTGFTNRGDYRAALAANFVSRPEDRQAFDQVFTMFWRNPEFLERLIHMMSPLLRGASEGPSRAAERRAKEALGEMPQQAMPQQEENQLLLDTSGTVTEVERLKSLDFEQMSAEEMTDALRLIATLRLPAPPVLSRRRVVHPGGDRFDGPRSLRRALRSGGEMTTLVRKARARRPVDVVALCDISGSMGRYARAVLHYLHGVTNTRGAGWGRVHAFTFGTQLTNISRHLANRDVDAALAAAGQDAPDWEGGTRIASSLRAFNRDWSRRVLGQGALVLLITDGLEQDPGPELTCEAQRLGLTAKRLVWVNPLLRYDGFAPKAAGIRAILPHVHSVRAGHSIESLEGLVAALAAPEDGGSWRRLMAAR